MRNDRPNIEARADDVADGIDGVASLLDDQAVSGRRRHPRIGREVDLPLRTRRDAFGAEHAFAEVEAKGSSVMAAVGHAATHARNPRRRAASEMRGATTKP